MKNLSLPALKLRPVCFCDLVPAQSCGRREIDDHVTDIMLRFLAALESSYELDINDMTDIDIKLLRV